jgi:hypothetical protein
VALLRLGCVVDAFRSAQLRRGPPPGGRYAAPLVGLAVIASVTVAPHLAAGYYDLQASRLLRSIAGAPAGSAAWLQRDRVSVLLLGGDAGPGRVGLRTDTMIVASVQRSPARSCCLGCRATLPASRCPNWFPLGQPVAGAGCCDEFGAFSPDGRRLAVYPQLRRPAQPGLAMVDVGQAEARPVPGSDAATPFGCQPCLGWSADGWLFFFSGGRRRMWLPPGGLAGRPRACPWPTRPPLSAAA